MLPKSVYGYPYMYMNDWQKFNKISLSEKKGADSEDEKHHKTF